MNRIYRLIWSRVTNTWIAVSENAKARGKSGSSRSRSVVGALALLSPMTFAAPTGGQISAGVGAISQTGVNTTVNQSSQNLAINWQSFGIAANETVRFNQPNATSIALNRVLGQNTSQILGSLSANGQVFILNSKGILFGAGSEVNVGGLVASTLNLSDADFMSGKYTFSNGGSAGSVINQGTLNANNGGYIALLAPEVSNQGAITATLGTALLAAGDKVTLNFNSGSQISYNIDQGSLNALAENKQLIQADGGQIIMSAKAANALATAVVNNTGIVEARTLQNINGTIMLLSDMQVGQVHVGGTLDASAPNGGNGGSIETSAAHVEVADEAKITTAAASGLVGSWLIDPVDFTIAATGGNMTGAALTTSLGNADVSILSSNGTTGTAGDVNVNDAVTWSSHKLTLNAQNNININANLNGTGTASLALLYGQSSNGGGTSTYNVNAVLNLPSGNNFSTKLGATGTTVNYTVITSLGVTGDATTAPVTATLQGMAAAANSSGHFALGGNIDAAATGTGAWRTSGGFTPIGYSSQFTGIFDGLGHTISNLYVNLGDQNAGLFSRTGSGSSIRNVGLVGATVGSSIAGNVGGLVGSNSGTVSNSYATGSVSGTTSIGGLVGSNYGTISNSYATGSVSGTTNVGGLVGINNYGGKVSNSYATGSVSGTTNVGGLVGNAYGGSILSSFWNSDVKATGIGTNGGATTTGTKSLTTTEMQQQSNFTGWDFTGTWIGYDGHTNPLLRSFMTPLTVTASNATKTYDGSAYSGTNSVTYSSTPNANLLGTVSYSGTSVGATNAGSYTIIPGGLYTNQQGYIISYANGTLSLNAAAISLSGTRVYDGTANLAAGIFTLSGLVGSQTLTLTGTGTLASKNVVTNNSVTLGSLALGNGTNGGLSSNYTFTGGTQTASITAASLAVTGITAVNKVYDTTLTAGLTGTATVTPLGSDSVTVTGTGSGVFANKNVGTGKAVTVSDYTLGSTDAGNYTIVQPSGLTANITAATLNVSGISASNKVYDATLTASLTGTASVTALGSDSVTVTGTGSGVFANKNVGTGKAVTVSGYTFGSTDAGNYTIVQPSGLTANITAATLNVTGISAANKVYDTTLTASLTGTATVTPLGSDSVTVTGTGSGVFANKNVGTGKAVTVSGYTLGSTDAGNYTIVQPSGLTANITPATLNVTGISASNKVYDATLTAGLTGTATVTPLGLDSVTVTGTGSGVFADKNVGNAKAVTVSGYTLGSTDAGNYTIAQPSGLTANITPATLNVTGVSAANKVYDGTTAATLTGTAVVSALGGDTVTLGGTGNGVFTDSSVGTAKPVTVSGYTLNGTDAGNYTIAQPAGLTADITAAAAIGPSPQILIYVPPPPVVLSDLKYEYHDDHADNNGRADNDGNTTIKTTTRSDLLHDDDSHFTGVVTIKNGGLKMPDDVEKSNRSEIESIPLSAASN